MFVCTVLSHPYKCVSCKLWQCYHQYNLWDSDNLLICLESEFIEIDKIYMGNLFFDLTEVVFLIFSNIALFLILEGVLFYLTQYGS